MGHSKGAGSNKAQCGNQGSPQPGSPRSQRAAFMAWHSPWHFEANTDKAGSQRSGEKTTAALASLCMCYGGSWATLWFCSVVGGFAASWVAKDGRWFLSLDLLAFLPYILFVFRCWCPRFWGLVVCLLAFLFGFGRFSCWWLRFASKQLGCLFFGCSTCGFWRLFLLVFVVCFWGLVVCLLAFLFGFGRFSCWCLRFASKQLGCLFFGCSTWGFWRLFLLVFVVCFWGLVVCLLAFLFGFGRFSCWWLRFASKQLGCLFFGCSTCGFWRLFLLVFVVCFWGLVVCLLAFLFGFGRFSCWCLRFASKQLGCLFFGCSTWGFWRLFLLVFVVCFWGLVVCLLAFLFGFGRFSCWCLRFASKQLGCLFFGCSTWGFWSFFLLVFMVCFWGLVVCLLAFVFCCLGSLFCCLPLRLVWCTAKLPALALLPNVQSLKWRRPYVYQQTSSQICHSCVVL